MATNTTPRKSAEESAETVTDTAAARPERTTRRAPALVGPPLGEGQEPVTVTLSHHLRIDGTDFTPGAEITVSPDYARRLRGQGFTART
ncbi:hypothetical protein [Streptomyces bobili]|uniref:DUF7210 domain-containing protein n=1 Tax=Streptomyces bobili TaxID=67280 RepID=A0ABZ1R596_9ACTN|nr:hypothetical protein [Streptomyces bobili]